MWWLIAVCAGAAGDHYVSQVRALLRWFLARLIAFVRWVTRPIPGVRAFVAANAGGRAAGSWSENRRIRREFLAERRAADSVAEATIADALAVPATVAVADVEPVADIAENAEIEDAGKTQPFRPYLVKDVA